MNLKLHLHFRSFHLALGFAGGLLLLTSPALAQKAEYEPQRWESQIAAFEKQDAATPPPRNGILFVGSSSIRKWDLSKSFPDLPVINRGFGRSHIADSTHFADRIITNYHPRIVVLYSGDNDISHKMTPRQVADDYRSFVRAVHAKLPETRIVFIASVEKGDADLFRSPTSAGS